MEFIFLICAIAGGTVLACQLAMTILGIGDDGGVDGHDLPDDLPNEVPDDLPDHGADHGHGHHDSNWLFSIISFRTIVAALTFFGLAGMASLRSELEPSTAVLLGVAAGFAAMVGVHRLMLLLSQLREDGTFQIRSTMGKRGTVYVPIPAARSGTGKVQLRLDDRIVELTAFTANHERLATGTHVEIVEIVGDDAIQVMPLADVASPVEHEIA